MKANLARCVARAILFTLVPAFGQTYKLRQSVEVRADVRLADLLPAEAPPSLRNLSASIPVCRAPQAGTVRILDAGFFTGKLKSLANLRMQLEIPHEIIVRRMAWRVYGQDIRDAVVQFLEQSPEHPIRLPGDSFWRDLRGPLTPKPHPTIEVQAVHEDPFGHSMLAELRCVPKQVCGNFLVKIPVPAGASASSDFPAAQKEPLREGPLWLVRAGTRAVALWQFDGMEISQPVICLGGGSRGQTIRVLNTQTHRAVSATVISANAVWVGAGPTPTSFLQGSPQ